MNSETTPATKPQQNRDETNGRYVAKFERLCRCGHSHGAHIAGGHECIAHDAPYLDVDKTDTVCSCEKYRAQRRAKGT